MSKPMKVLEAEPELELSSGHRIVVRTHEGGENVEIRSPEGQVEMTITLTAQGPVIRMTGAKLELEATDTVSLKGRTVEVQASESATVHSDGHLTMTSGLDTRTVAQGDVHVLGTIVWLN